MRELRYKTTAGGKDLFLHVSPPRESPAPTAVFFHGGGWVRGTWQQFLPQAARLNALGMLTVLVEYRLEGPVAATEDAVDAMNAVVDLAGDLGCDPTRIVAIGGSAGGQLALATAVLELPNTVPDRRPAAVVLLNPVTNTCGDFPAGFGRRHFYNADHAAQYSPVHQVGEKTPPMLIMHGTADTAVHHENSVDFARKVTSYGGNAEVILYPGQRHGFFNPRTEDNSVPGDGNGTYFDRTTREMVRFVRGTVLEEAAPE